MLFVKHFFALAGKTGCRGQKRETPGGPLGPPGVVVRAWGLEPQRIAAREPKGDVTLVKEKIQKYVGGVKCILSTEIQVQSDKLPVRHTFVRSQICKTSRKSTK